VVKRVSSPSEGIMYGSNVLMKKLLVLSGPAGSGKSTTVQSLAKDFGMQIVEWINPIDENKLSTQNDGRCPISL
jgi:tRNA uridine 5-carbamoylmethylation protein Kti12